MIRPEDVRTMSEQEKIELLGMLADGDEAPEVDPETYLTLAADTSPAVRKLAVQALWDLGDERYIDVLTDIAEHDADREVRTAALATMGIYIYQGAATLDMPEAPFLRVRRYLIEIARDAAQPLDVRRAATEALSFDAADDVAELIEWAYRHESEELNLTALFCMGRSQSSRWSEVIVKELSAEDRKRRLEAINAVSEGFVAEATPSLRNLAMSQDKEERLAAIWALAHAGGPGALEVLEMCAESHDEEVREAAEEAIMEYASLRESESEEGGGAGDAETRSE